MPSAVASSPLVPRGVHPAVRGDAGSRSHPPAAYSEGPFLAELVPSDLTGASNERIAVVLGITARTVEVQAAMCG
jgi:hypothetical protein